MNPMNTAASHPESLGSLEEKLGVHFRDQGLLTQALVHRSYQHEHPDSALPSNERLEFLGDAVLGLIVAEHIYHRYPEMEEGALTSIRAAVVKTPTLARLGAELRLGSYMLMSRGEEVGGGRSRPAILACAFEAVTGAMVIDQGLETTQRFIIGRFGPLLDEVVRDRLDRDDKSRLQEFVQGLLGITPTYRIVETSGSHHEPLFTVEVSAGDQVLGHGIGHNKREAEQLAAAEALIRMDKLTARAAPPG
jgi:ribonuclease III